jgi:hypothetical protein
MMVMKNLTTTIVVSTSCTQERRKGSKTTWEAPKNKHKPKPTEKSQEGATMVKKFVHLKNNLMMITTTFAFYT